MEPTGVALVTGASRGIGRAVALELASRGFTSVATMRDTEEGASLLADAAGLPGRLRIEHLDVNDPESVTMPDGLRVLVNNAGVESDNLPIELANLELWRHVFETNVFGLVNVTRAAIPMLRESGGGVVANITSSSVLAPVPFMGLYRASKAAVGALGQSLQAEVAQWGIRVVEIMPGPIETEMLAASDRPSPAVEDDRYRRLAEHLWETRRQIRDRYTPVGTAATRIVDAIVDDESALRVGCDPLSDAMLAAQDRASGHDAWVRPQLDHFLRS